MLAGIAGALASCGPERCICSSTFWLDAAVRCVKNVLPTPIHSVITAMVTRMPVSRSLTSGRGLVFLHGDLTVEHALVRPQRIARRENYAKRRPARPAACDWIRPQQDQEFAHETVEHRQSHARERDEEEERGHHRHRRRQPTVLR